MALDETSKAIGSLEARVANLETTVADTKEALAEVNKKLDTLLASLNIGKGAWLAYVKLGAFIVGLGGLVTAASIFFKNLFSGA